MQVSYEICLMCDFFHTCVAARILEELWRIRIVFEGTTYMYVNVCGMLHGAIGEWMLLIFVV